MIDNKIQYFTVGPSAIYDGVEKWCQEAYKLGILSLYHRSDEFQEIYKITQSQLRSLLSIPDSHSILFLNSATEIWERSVHNLVESKVVQFVNGSFSQKWSDFSEELGKNTLRYTKLHGSGFGDIMDIVKDDAVEMICLTQNETSSGVQIPAALFYQVRKLFPNALLAVDMVSSAPFFSPDWEIIDTAFFSIQKGFGLPAGLGVWIVNKKCLSRFHDISKKVRINPHHRLDRLIENDLRYQTVSTPNSLGIYLLGKVAADMNLRGISNIRAQTIEKARILYQAINISEKMNTLVPDDYLQSQTTILASLKENGVLLNYLLDNKILVSKGYGFYKNSEIRIANFPSHSIEDIKRLAEFLGNF